MDYTNPDVKRMVNIILENDLEMVLTRDEVLASVENYSELVEWAVKSWNNAQEVVYGI
jgi:hypothetical protein